MDLNLGCRWPKAHNAWQKGLMRFEPVAKFGPRNDTPSVEVITQFGAVAPHFTAFLYWRARIQTRHSRIRDGLPIEKEAFSSF
jgi:hypothetical protein